jgi:hypothetical protein
MAALKEGLNKLSEADRTIISRLPGYASLLNALQKGRAVDMIDACCVQGGNKRNLQFMKMIQYQVFYKLNVGMVNAISAAFKEDSVEYSHMI